MEIRQLHLSDDGFKVAFLEGKLSIDCLEIKLTQKGTDKPRVYSAPGFLLLSPQNGAEGRLVVQRGEDNPYAPLQRLIESSKIAAGELIPETFYYRLEAKDVFRLMESYFNFARTNAKQDVATPPVGKA